MAAKRDLLSEEQSERTRGDGMDNSLFKLSDYLASFKIDPRSLKKHLGPIVPVGPIIKTVPRYVPRERKNSSYLLKKPREPKFVPCEPFKGAVEPIVPKKRVVKIVTEVVSKNNVDIQDLVSQMSDIRTHELRSLGDASGGTSQGVIAVKQWEKEKSNYETDIKNLRESNAHLENQLKFQAQVNSELKTLLVAAVGEDLESRVQHLTEDKLQLARALLSSANHLTSHQEQTEWLSGQCEVWRSKFLASSLMVEELARWKSALGNRVNDLQSTIKLLLEERNKTRSYNLQTYNILQQLNPAETQKHLKTANLIDLSLMNLQLGESLALSMTPEIKAQLSDKSKLNIAHRNASPSVHPNVKPTVHPTVNHNVHLNINHKSETCDLLKLTTYTPGESCAIKLLKNPVSLSGKPDQICIALRDAALSVSSGQLYLQHPNQRATCCKHCKGEILDV